MIDHRPLGWQAIRGPEGVVQFWRSWLEMVPDAQLRMETLAGDEQHIAARLAAYGRAVAAAGGGFMEYVGIAVATIRGGRSARTEYVDTDEQEAALARLAELMRGGVP